MLTKYLKAEPFDFMQFVTFFIQSYIKSLLKFLTYIRED